MKKPFNIHDWQANQIKQRLLEKEGVKSMGNIKEKEFPWPTSREDSLKLLNHFCDNLLVYFGDYQDAMDPNEKYLFHSRLSFSLNTKMLSPKEVIEQVVETWRKNKDDIDISQVEGFIRQILGWREFMRGMYWKEMPDYESNNVLGCTNRIPDFYWSEDTKIICLKK